MAAPIKSTAHLEADFVEALGARSVLDAGCGTGRVAIELARRGLDVVGIDLDPFLLRSARVNGPQITWHHADLTRANLHRKFDLVLLAGNVMIFLAPGTAPAALRNMARHLDPGGLLVAGFQLAPGYLDLAEYDRFAEAARLELVARYSSWVGETWGEGGGYPISVHRRLPVGR